MSLDPTYLGYRAAAAFASVIPSGAVGPVSSAIGKLAPRIMGERAAMVARHQKRVRPDLADGELDAAVRSTFSSYVRYWLESFRLPGIPVDVLEDRFTVDGYEHVQAGLDAGRGVILAMPHLGSWEWAGFWLTSVQGVRVTAVAEAIDPPELADWFVDLRARFGLHIVPLDRDAGARSSRALAENQVLALLCDRDITGNGIEVEFFGERTTLPAGPATIALRSGAPLIPACVFVDGDEHHAVAHPPIDTTRRGKLRQDAERVTADLAKELEAMISKAPEQWHLLQPNWPSDRSEG